MTQKFIIAIDIKTTAPLHITAIEKGTYDPELQRLNRYGGKDAAGVGTSLTRTMAIAGAAQPKENGQPGMYTPEVPVIPASTLASKVRHAAANLVFESFIKRGLTITPAAYNTMASGMATTELNADAATPETMRVARRDPFLGLFGGTSFALSSGCVVSEGWPLLEITRDLLMSEPIADVGGFRRLDEMTDAVAIIRRNDVMSLQGENLEGVVGLNALAEYARAESDARVDSKAKKSAGETGKKTDLRTFNAVEVVRPGLGFAIRVEITAYTPAHLGLMLMALQKFIRDGQVGGKAARGMGRFVVVASRLYELDPANRQTVVLSEPFGDKQSGYAFADHDKVDVAVTQAQDYIDGVQTHLIEAFAAADYKAIKAMLATAEQS